MPILRRVVASCAAAVLLTALTGCVASAPASTEAPATDAWIGRWAGPEGTYLEISGGRGAYVVTIKDLDRSRSFQGTARDGRIAFERDGVPETLHATNGDGTGMKWLAGRSTCLTVKLGEGFCREAGDKGEASPGR